MKRRGRSVRKAALPQLVFELLRREVEPSDVLKVLRPKELTYLCELCSLLDELGACSDVEFPDDYEDNEEEEE